MGDYAFLKKKQYFLETELKQAVNNWDSITRYCG